MKGITKSCLKKVKSKTFLTFEELRTIIENALNSRPLIYIDEEPDSNTITPNHLFTDET